MCRGSDSSFFLASKPEVPRIWLAVQANCWFAVSIAFNLGQGASREGAGGQFGVAKRSVGGAFLTQGGGGDEAPGGGGLPQNGLQLADGPEEQKIGVGRWKLRRTRTAQGYRLHQRTGLGLNFLA